MSFFGSAVSGIDTGENNTASNQGVGGVGLFISKVGVDLQFRNINAASTKISVTLDGANKEVDLDVVEANIDHNGLFNFLANEHIDWTVASVGVIDNTNLSRVLNDLNDVDTISTVPVLNDLLEFDGTNWIPLNQREEGVVKADNVVTATVVNDGVKFKVTAATPLTFSAISRFPLKVSNQFPGQTPTSDPATFTPFLYESVAAKWLENSKNLQTHTWRILLDYTRSSTTTNREIIFELSNPLSSFMLKTVVTMPNGAALQTNQVQVLFVSIADSASIGFGYEIFIMPFGDDITINDLSITRISSAIL